MTQSENDVQTEIRGMVQFAFLRRPLAELLDACAGSSLGIIILKGAALAETVYAQPGLRPFGDLDVLVRPADAPHACALLLGLGYTADAAAVAEIAMGKRGEANFFRDTGRGPVVVELHTCLLNNVLLRPQVRLDLAGVWQRSVSACLAGRAASVLGPEDQILHLCLHLAGHYLDARRSLQDIARVCTVQPVNWLLFVSLCRDARAETLSYCGLFAAVTEYGASVPPSVLQSLAPRNPNSLEFLVTAQVGSGGGGAEVQRFLLLWRMLDRAAARRGALRHLLFPSRAWLHAHYYFDAPAPRLLSGVLLYGRHLRFLVETLGRQGRKSRHRA